MDDMESKSKYTGKSKTLVDMEYQGVLFSDYKNLIISGVMIVIFIISIYVYVVYIDIVRYSYFGQFSVTESLKNNYNDYFNKIQALGLVTVNSTNDGYVFSSANSDIKVDILDDNSANIILQNNEPYLICKDVNCKYKIVQFFDENNKTTKILKIESY